jgi:hypothetical protein
LFRVLHLSLEAINNNLRYIATKIAKPLLPNPEKLRRLSENRKPTAEKPYDLILCQNKFRKLMSLDQFLHKIKHGEAVNFQESIAVIDQHYQYIQTEFRNGVSDPLINPPGKNEGSCKIFAFAKLHQLSKEQTLGLFGDYYRIDVLGHPDSNDHLNIRTFMRDGWEGIAFPNQALLRR